MGKSSSKQCECIPLGRGKLGTRLDGEPTKRQILLVIDMQRDYDVEANIDLYNHKKNPYAGDLVSGCLAMDEVLKRDWDKVVFSQDKLTPALLQDFDIPEEHWFCCPPSEGVSIMPQLLTSDVRRKWKSAPMFFAKNRNDVFNELVFPYFSDETPQNLDTHKITDMRGYDVDDAHGGRTLGAVLAEQGFDCHKADLTVIGTVADMCVMTSVVHACVLGYSVSVLDHAVLGGDQDDVAVQHGWILPEPPKFASSGATDWRIDVYNSCIAAGRDRAFRYMEAAGAKIVSSLVPRAASVEALAPRGFPRYPRQVRVAMNQAVELFNGRRGAEAIALLRSLEDAHPGMLAMKLVSEPKSELAISLLSFLEAGLSDFLGLLRKADPR